MNAQSIKLYCMIGLGGMIGATCRYAISFLFVVGDEFPYQTLSANLLGCFCLSFLLHSDYLSRKLSASLLIALSTGVIGSFTTFSTVAVETVTLLHTNILVALFYIFISFIGGLGFSYLGYVLAAKKKVVR